MTRLALAIVLAALLPVSLAHAQATSHSRHAAHARAHAKASAGKQAALRGGTAYSTGIPGPGRYGADPSYGPGTPLFRQLQREGRCVMDEGYGRFTYCDRW
jgi:hypothetical protein